MLEHTPEVDPDRRDAVDETGEALDECVRRTTQAYLVLLSPNSMARTASVHPPPAWVLRRKVDDDMVAVDAVGHTSSRILAFVTTIPQ